MTENTAPEKLSPEHFSKFDKWLTSKGLKKPCPLCGGVDMIAGNILASAIMDENRNIFMDTTIPHIPLTCVNCGYTILFSAVCVGLIPPILKGV